MSDTDVDNRHIIGEHDASLFTLALIVILFVGGACMIDRSMCINDGKTLGVISKWSPFSGCVIEPKEKPPTHTISDKAIDVQHITKDKK